MRITVIGAGFMGTVIATIYASKGHEVVLHDLNQAMLGSFGERVLPILEGLSGDAAIRKQTVSRIRIESVLSKAVADSKLVHEIIHESLPHKQALFGELDLLCAPGTVLATNTSSFLLTDICRDVAHKDRVIGIHFITPAHVVKALEVIVNDRTPAALVEWTKDFVKDIGYHPMVCRESPGFLVNRIQLAMLAEIHRIVDEGLASVEDVDTAVRLSLGPRWALWGALACEDLVASKRTALAVLEYMQRQTGSEHFKPTRTLVRMVEEGKLGAAAGRGWYEWNEPNAELVIRRDRQLAEILDWLAARPKIVG